MTEPTDNYGRCVTHHHACDCREAAFRELLEACEGLASVVGHCARATPNYVLSSVLERAAHTTRTAIAKAREVM